MTAKKLTILLMLAIMLFAAGCGNGSETVPEQADNNTPPVTEPADENSDANDMTDAGEPAVNAALADYMASVEEQSDAIKYSLENDVLNQSELNMKSQELYELWDGALNYLWGELKNQLPEDQFAELLKEQLTWIDQKEQAVTEAGKEVEGGSLYPLVVNSTAAEITEERVYELYELLK
ncbi:MAG: DUF1311 domain-containing protein [Peptococcaceae bacterium]|nr:DUF1311 domain-containing protein [Peptococcaceae bacterium]